MARRRRTSGDRCRFHRSSRTSWITISRPRPGDPEAFVFTSPDGGPLRHTNFYRRHYKPAVTAGNLDHRTRFHDLRHTAAALMIAEGAHLLAVKQRLGHSSIQVTADRYGHLFPSLEDALTARLDESFRAAMAPCSDHV